MIKKTQIVKPEEYYSLKQIHQLNLFKFKKSYTSFRALVKNDILNGNEVFKAVKTGEGNGTRYLIKGSTILNILDEVKLKGKIF